MRPGLPPPPQRLQPPPTWQCRKCMAIMLWNSCELLQYTLHHTCAYCCWPTMKGFVCISQWKWWMPLCPPAPAPWQKNKVSLCASSAQADTRERPSLLTERYLCPKHRLPRPCMCPPPHTHNTHMHAASQGQQSLHQNNEVQRCQLCDATGHTHAHTTGWVIHLTPDSRWCPRSSVTAGRWNDCTFASHTDLLQHGKKTVFAHMLFWEEAPLCNVM